MFRSEERGIKGRPVGPLQPVCVLYYFKCLDFASVLVPLREAPAGRLSLLVNLIIPYMLLDLVY
jgi:hypothetical protein